MLCLERVVALPDSKNEKFLAESSLLSSWSLDLTTQYDLKAQRRIRVTVTSDKLSVFARDVADFLRKEKSRDRNRGS